MAKKTRDGVPIKNIELVVKTIAEITMRKGGSHRIILNSQNMRPCPVAGSTDVRKYVVPWLRQITGYSANEIYGALRQGRWQYNN